MIAAASGGDLLVGLFVGAGIVLFTQAILAWGEGRSE